MGKTVKEVMDTWTVQMGYPVVTINRQDEFPKATTIHSEVILCKNSAGVMMAQNQPLRNKKGGENKGYSDIIFHSC